MTRDERVQIARKRLVRVLEANVVCLARTLEQKIADAGPNPQRIDPHILTEVRSALGREGVILSENILGAPWYFLARTPYEEVKKRLAVLTPIHARMQKPGFSKRLGQTMEIAVYRALKAEKRFKTLGGFPDLDDHDDSTPYKKKEPPSFVSGQSMEGEADFMLLTRKGQIAAVEVKNVREWLYTNREEVRAIITKALAVDAVPVLIARRIHFVTFRVLNPCGVIIHQIYNQMFPAADQALAEKAKHKDLLGFHDIRTGNQPDNRLTKFISGNLPDLLDDAREKFEANRDLLEAFSSQEMPYKEFAARVRRRSNETNEDHDWEL